MRTDLSFDEALVCKIIIGKRKIFFTTIYRSPSNHANSIEFQRFLNNFEALIKNVSTQKRHSAFYVGDFNAHSQNWWPYGNTNDEGILIDEMTSSLGLQQLISEPTNFELNKNPSCIDLIFSDQPNTVMEVGVRPSPDNLCKHQILFANLNLEMGRHRT